MMGDSIWSDTPPTEAGWYWVKSRNEKIRVVANLCRNGRWNIDGMLDEWGDKVMRVVYVFGPRIPSAEELAAIAKLQRRERPEEPEIDAVLRELFGIQDHQKP